MKKLLIILFLFVFVNTTYAYWEEINNFGDIEVITIAENNDILYAGTMQGIFISTNNGQNWNKSNEGLTELRISDIAFNDDYVFVGTAKGVFRSSDNGSSWLNVNNGLRNNSIIQNITVHNNILYVTIYINELYKSDDNGNSWERLIFEVNNNTIISKLAILDNEFYLGFHGAGILYSSDSGLNWTFKNNGLNPNVRTILVDELNLYAGTTNGLYLSIDKGENWQKIALDDVSIKKIIKIQSAMYIVTNKGLYISTDAGENWILIQDQLIDLNIYNIVIKDEIFFVGTNSGVFASEDKGETWNDVSNGLYGYKRVRAFITVGDYLIASAINSGVYFSSDNGDTWEKRDNGLDNNQVTAFAHIDEHIYAGTHGYGVYYSTNYGENWLPKNNGIENINVYSLAVENEKIAIGSAGIYLSEDKGETWNLILDGKTLWEYYEFNELVIKDDLLIGGAGMSRPWFLGTSFQTMDWSLLPNYSAPYYVSTFRVYSLLFFDNNIFVGMLDNPHIGLFHTTNYGETWSDKSNGISDKFVYSLELINGYLLAGTKNKGLYISSDMGENWTLKNVGLRDDASVGNFANNDEYIFAGGFKYGFNHYLELNYFGSNLYRAKIEAVTSVDDSKPQRNKLTIFPNPSSGFLHIQTDAIILRTELSDILGRTVFKQSGNVEQISTSGLTPGLYLLKLYTYGGEVLTEKVVVR